MEFVRGIYNLKSYHRGCVLTIGNFDGFHRGHQFLIFKLKKVGFERGLPVVVMIFEPHPEECFLGPSLRLFRLRDKVKYLSSAGIDVLLCILFNSQFALIEPYEFISNILVEKLNVRVVYVGDNFRFGFYRQGDFNFLRKMSQNFGFEVMRIGTYLDDSGRRISSTAVRNALVEDRLIKAEMLLGHVYSISGRVVHGMKLGHYIGFPTLNILIKGQRLAINGVYAVKVYGVMVNGPILGVANVGVCPTVHKFFQQRLEIHLLDCSINLYGCYIEVTICAKIRNEKRFSSLEALRFQIKNDIRTARDFFKKDFLF